MTLKLAENIRAFRKQRSLTQEQLAEVLGVTVGAVYKWESGQSVPELRLLVEIADFFDTSVDVLLGYEMKDNRLKATATRLKEYRHSKDLSGLSEAEKALKKYPNTFEIVYNSAVLYKVFGTETQDSKLLERALELFQSALLLLSQNTDPEINELTLHGSIARIHLALGERDRAVELLKQYNAGGIYDHIIGLSLAADCGRPGEAATFLEPALLKNITAIIHIIVCYVNVFCDRGDYSSAQDILLWGIGILAGLREADRPNFLDRISCTFYVCLAYAYGKSGDSSAACRVLRDAKELARQFDAAPNYETNAVRFVTHGEEASAHDDLGPTAADGIQKTIASFADETLSALWKGINENEQKK